MNNEGMFYTNLSDYETKEDMMNDFIALRMYDMAKDKEIEELNKALEEIQTILIKKQKAKGLCNQILNVQEERCLDIVNKALGSDKE